MHTFAPEFAHHWFASPTEGDESSHVSQDDDAGSQAQQEALEELAERVSAARSVV